MTRISLGTAISESFVRRLQGMAQGGSRSVGNLLSGTSSVSSIKDGLRLGARTYGTAVQGLNSLVSLVNISQTELGKIGGITDKLISIAERAAQSTTSSDTRNRLDTKFKKLGREMLSIVQGAKVGDHKLLDRQGLEEIFVAVGLDSKHSQSIVDLFERFVLANKDTALASEHATGARPAPVPPGAYQLVSSAAGNGTFSSAASVGVGDTPAQVASADLNGDGFVDLVNTNSADASASVMLGNGDGTFRSAVSVATQAGPGSLTLGDLNGDHLADLALVGSQGKLDVLLSNGDGTFAARVSYAAGVSVSDTPTGLVSVDFNGDGKLDLATALATSAPNAAIGVLLGNGDGTFLSAVTYALSALSTPQALASADVNGDGFADLATVDSGSGSVSLLLGNGNGTFRAAQSFAAGSSPSSLTLADLNGDGMSDLVVTDLVDPGNVNVLLGNGDGTFQSRVSYQAGANPQSVVAADMNGDGKLDLATADSAISGGSSSASILLGNGDGTFGAALSYLAGATRLVSVSAADYNNDNIIDLAAVDQGADQLRTLSGDSAGPTVVWSAPQSKQFDSIFEDGRGIRSRPDAYLMLNDLKALRKQVDGNLKALDQATQTVQENIKLVRATGLALLDLSNQLTGSEDAAHVAESLRSMLRSNAGAALNQLDNLDSITVASLSRAST